MKNKTIKKVKKQTKKIAKKANKAVKEAKKFTKKKIVPNVKKAAKVTKETATKLTNKTKETLDINKDGVIDSKDVEQLLDVIYSKSVDGVDKISKPVKDICDEYLEKYKDPQVAAKKLIISDITKCTTSGFVNGLGGLPLIAVTVPADITSVLYVQMRMIASVAYLAGLKLNSDATKTFVYACLAGVSVSSVLKNLEIKFGEKITTATIKKIPGKALIAINKKVGFRFLTKFGEKGLVNFGKAIPVIGGVIGGTADLVETKIIADRSFKFFFEGDYVSVDNDDKNVVDVDIQKI